MNTTSPCVRGCGTRSAGGVYLTLGIGIGGTLHVEDLILDPVRLWPGDWKEKPRSGFKLVANKGGWNDVVIFIGESFYLSAWDFVEEARRYGISRKVPPTFPIEKLTPGKSQMIFLHRKAYPRFTSQDAELDSLILSSPLPHCKMHWEPEIWQNAFPGWHPKVEKETFCTFSHQHFSGILHDASCDSEGKFTIHMPAFDYEGYMPVVRTGVKLEWAVGAFMATPISHLEMPHRLNKDAAQRANKAGYEVVKTDW